MIDCVHYPDPRRRMLDIDVTYDHDTRFHHLMIRVIDCGCEAEIWVGEIAIEQTLAQPLGLLSVTVDGERHLLGMMAQWTSQVADPPPRPEFLQDDYPLTALGDPTGPAMPFGPLVAAMLAGRDWDAPERGDLDAPINTDWQEDVYQRTPDDGLDLGVDFFEPQGMTLDELLGDEEPHLEGRIDRATAAIDAALRGDEPRRAVRRDDIRVEDVPMWDRMTAIGEAADGWLFAAPVSGFQSVIDEVAEAEAGYARWLYAGVEAEPRQFFSESAFVRDSLEIRSQFDESFASIERTLAGGGSTLAAMIESEQLRRAGLNRWQRRREDLRFARARFREWLGETLLARWQSIKIWSDE